jgi:maltose alpha-D-glucosyltransferase/alpha-amylase
VPTETPHLTVPADPLASAAADASNDPLWYKDAIVYQAHVKSFLTRTTTASAISGAGAKLDYLQSLGITCIWLLPFFPSPLRDDV